MRIVSYYNSESRQMFRVEFLLLKSDNGGGRKEKKNTHLAEKARKVSSDRTVSCDELILFNIFWLCFKTACFLKTILIWISTLNYHLLDKRACRKHFAVELPFSRS